RAVLGTVDTVIAVGQAPEQTLEQFREASGRTDLSVGRPAELESNEVLFWSRRTGPAPLVLVPAPGRTERRRHTRKYAEGELPPERCFYFRGPDGKLKLKAQNLFLFLQLADGVDDATWEYHLRRGDYSGWFREKIKDEELADETARIEASSDMSPAESRASVRSAIERHYTLPAASEDGKT